VYFYNSYIARATYRGNRVSRHGFHADDGVLFEVIWC
jgi:hypothetical protein